MNGFNRKYLSDLAFLYLECKDSERSRSVFENSVRKYFRNDEGADRDIGTLPRSLWEALRPSKPPGWNLKTRKPVPGLPGFFLTPLRFGFRMLDSDNDPTCLLLFEDEVPELFVPLVSA